QLAHNEWDAAAGMSRPKVVYNFGREDQLDRAGVNRLIASLSRVVEPAAALAATAPAELAFSESRPMGGAHVLDGLWQRLGIGKIMTGLAASRRRDDRVERVLFALVANRALAPSSKLAAAGWVCHDAHIPGLAALDEDACYRAMDRLLEIEDELAEQVYWQVATLLDLEVDLLFFDTTSTYFELDEPDTPIERDERGHPVALDERPSPDNGANPGAGGGESSGATVGFRSHGHSKDHRPDLPQVVVGMAVTRTGIPVRCWCWPGNTADSALIRQVRDDLRDWKLSRIIWVADRGFTSAENRRYLQRGGGHYILGEKLRSGSAEATAALARQGRYQQVADNLRVKQVRVGDGDRFVVCHNPEQAERDAALRTLMLTHLHTAIDGSDALSPTKRAELRGQISTKPGLNRYLRVTPGGLLRVDAKAIAAETKLDGKYLLRCSDPTLSPEDIALGYKQLLEVERGWRDMKQIIDLRPVYHRKEERIRAHVVLCWLALLLIRIIETTCDQTWTTLRGELQRLHVGVFTGPAGTFRQRTEITTAQRNILAKLDLTAPPKIVELTPNPAV
ncbi:MAG: IS1634 family transposase, partial [Steroidobacteraceae bacterium]